MKGSAKRHNVGYIISLESFIHIKRDKRADSLVNNRACDDNDRGVRREVRDGDKIHPSRPHTAQSYKLVYHSNLSEKR